MLVILSLCTVRLALSVPVLVKNSLQVQDDHPKASVTGHSLGRRPLYETPFLPPSDTTVPYHSSKFLLRPSSSLLPSLSYRDPLEDFLDGLLTSALLLISEREGGGE